MVQHPQEITKRKAFSIRQDYAEKLTERLAKDFMDCNGAVIDPIQSYSLQFNHLEERAKTILGELNMGRRFADCEKFWIFSYDSESSTIKQFTQRFSSKNSLINPY